MIQLKRTTTVLTLLLLAKAACAQQFDRAIDELSNIRNTYSDSGYNSYTINYRYAQESAPGKTLDTLTAFFKMKAGKYYCKMDKIEFLQDDSVNATIYHNEKVIVLTNPTISTEKGRLMIDGWDAAFVAANIDSAWFSDNKATRTLSFHFTPESPYSSCSIVYNNETYQPQKIMYVQRATQNYTNENSKPDGIIITILFSGFNKSAFKENVFDYKKFIKRQDKKWAATPGYSGYTIVNNVYEE